MYGSGGGCRLSNGEEERRRKKRKKGEEEVKKNRTEEKGKTEINNMRKVRSVTPLLSMFKG